MFTYIDTVLVVRCSWPSRVENGYFMCHPSDDARYGATCRFGCYPGYKLIGNTLQECLISGQWNNNPPYCESRKNISYVLSLVLLIRLLHLFFYYFEFNSS